MRAGKMRDKIRIEKPVQVRSNTSSAITTTWETVAVRRAQISPVNGSEQAFLGGEVSEYDALIFVRYDRSLKDMTNEWRVVDTRTDRIYDLEYTPPISDGLRLLTLRCIYRTK